LQIKNGRQFRDKTRECALPSFHYAHIFVIKLYFHSVCTCMMRFMYLIFCWKMLYLYSSFMVSHVKCLWRKGNVIQTNLKTVLQIINDNKAFALLFSQQLNNAVEFMCISWIPDDL